MKFENNDVFILEQTKMLKKYIKADDYLLENTKKSIRNVHKLYSRLFLFTVIPTLTIAILCLIYFMGYAYPISCAMTMQVKQEINVKENEIRKINVYYADKKAEWIKDMTEILNDETRNISNNTQADSIKNEKIAETLYESATEIRSFEKEYYEIYWNTAKLYFRQTKKITLDGKTYFTSYSKSCAYFKRSKDGWQLINIELLSI